MCLLLSSPDCNPSLEHDVFKCKKKCCKLGHDITCKESCCKNKTKIDRWETVLKSYEELTEPTAMAKPTNTLMADDPLNHAFKLTSEIKELKKNHLEVKNELKDLAKKSKAFTFDMLDVCKNNDEVNAFLNDDYVKTLRNAVAVKHKEFIAHRYVQQLVYEMVQYDEYGARSFLSGLFMYALYTLSFPIWACVFIFDSEKEFWVSQKMYTTFGKFVSHTSQFCTFVALLVFTSLGDTHEPSTTEYVIYVFIVAMSLQEIHKICKERRRYFRKWWNNVLILMLAGFLLAGLLWIIGSAAVGGWSAKQLASHWDIAGHKILLLANSLFSISSVISVLYLGSLCQVNSMFGPLQLSTLRMFKDIVKFLTIFLGVFFAFTLGVRSLYSYNRSLQVDYLNKNNITAYRMDDGLSTFGDAWQVMFWALFDQTNLEKFENTHPSFQITSRTGKFLFAIYLITAVLVGINMLIAMMNNSFEYVAADKDRLNWKMSRTAMWLEYADKNDYILPAPYNILHCPISYARKKWKERKENSKQRRMNVEEDTEGMEMNNMNNDCDHHTIGEIKKAKDLNRQKILQEIARRYLEKKTKKLEENGEELLFESNV